MQFLKLAFSLALGQRALAASSADWRSRSIYQVMTDRFARTDGSTTATCKTADAVYCGGTYQGLINHLDYIQGMGFDAIWISPVTEQLDVASAYHGYWQTNLYGVNSHFGTVADLKSLASALHSRGMYLMVDVVVNDFAASADTTPANVDYANFNPFNVESDFHPYCPVDYSNINSIQDCWLGGTVLLPDVKTEAPNVASAYQTWISALVSNYSIDGLRLDTVHNVNTGFWSGFVPAAGIYMVGEVDDGDAATVCGYQNYIPGVLNYPTYFPIISAFESTSGDMSALAGMINSVKESCADTSLLGTFTENHDVPRFASLNGDISAAMNVIAYPLLTDGIPIVYEGQEQHYNAEGGSNLPYNREAVWFSGYDTGATLYKLVATLNKVRKTAIALDSAYLTYKNYPIYTDTSTIAMRKGYDGKQVITVLSNLGSGGASYTLKLGNTGFTSGMQVTELLTCAILTADSSGNIAVPMAKGLPKVYMPTSAISSSGLCASLAAGYVSQ